jgi:hypothetical protein
MISWVRSTSRSRPARALTPDPGPHLKKFELPFDEEDCEAATVAEVMVKLPGTKTMA